MKKNKGCPHSQRRKKSVAYGETKNMRGNWCSTCDAHFVPTVSKRAERQRIKNLLAEEKKGYNSDKYLEKEMDDALKILLKD